MESSETSLSDFEELDENFHIGRDVFILPNGDSYDGEYVAHRNGLVWREGYGTYATSDGQVYTGRWYNDKLKESRHVRISYADGVFFEGKLMDNQYFGPGRYGLNENLELSCEFVENKPVGEVIMMDHRGRVWCGVAQENDCFLLPEHIFFNNISPDAGKGKRKTTAKSTSMTYSMPGKKSIISAQEVKSQISQKKFSPHSDKTLEAKIFAKTKKTISDLRFEDSEWYQEYLLFKENFGRITKIVETSGENSLDAEDKKWYGNYLKFKDRYLEIRKGNKKDLADYNLLKLFNSDEYKNSCPPISVIYPTKSSKELVPTKNEDTEKEHESGELRPNRKHSTRSLTKKSSTSIKRRSTASLKRPSSVNFRQSSVLFRHQSPPTLKSRSSVDTKEQRQSTK